MRAQARVARLIAFNTVRELLRNKLLYNLIIFAVLLIGGSLFVAQLTVGSWDRVILDLGLAAVEFAGVLVAVLIGVSLVAGEIDRKTIFPILAKPVARSAFIAGRYLGLISMLAVNVAVMAGCLHLVLRMANYSLSRTAAAAALLIFVELLVMAAAAIFFASFTTPVLAVSFSLSLFLIGHLVGDLRAFHDRSTSGFARAVTEAAWRVLPDLELFNLKPLASNQLPLPPGVTGSAALYGLAYALGLLVLGAAIFSRRDLK
jgi:ABC-type transport system involved in multi-copper enzyme maturation permease subunit